MNELLPDAPSPTAAREVVLQLSDKVLNFARYDRLSLANFSFSTFPIETHSSFSQNLQRALHTLPILQAPFARLEVLLPAAVTPVPLDDFEEEAADTIYNYCFSSEKPRKVFYDALPCANSALLYGFDVEKVRALNALFPQVHYNASLTALLQYFSTKGQALAKGRKRLFVHLHDTTADIAVFDDRKLVSINSYAVQSPTDVAYYAFNLALHTAMSQQDDHFFVYGTESLRPDVVKEMKPFVKELYAPHVSGEFNRHKVAATPHIPYDLLIKIMQEQ